MAFSLGSVRRALEDIVRSDSAKEKNKAAVPVSPCPLPEDVLLHVFGFLPKSGLSRATLVCRGWSELISVDYRQKACYSKLVPYNLKWHERVDAGFLPRFAGKHGQMASINLSELLRHTRAPLDSWSVTAGDCRTVQLSSSVGFQLVVNVASNTPSFQLTEQQPRQGKARKESRSFKLSNGVKHKEKEPFTAVEIDGQLFVKTKSHLLKYKIEKSGVTLLWSHEEPKIELLGATTNTLVAYEPLEKDQAKFRLLSFEGKMIMAYECPSDLRLTRLIGPALVLVNGRILTVKNIHPNLKEVYSYTFTDRVVSYAASNMQLACLLADGTLAYCRFPAKDRK